MKHILLITNVLEEGTTLQYAAKFCKHYKAKLHILNIDEKSEPILISSPHYYKKFLYTHDINKVHRVTEEITDQIGKILDSQWVDIKVNGGNAQSLVEHVINDNFIDFIIIDKSTIELENLSKFKNLFFDVIPTPLIVIPKFEVFKPFKSLNFLTTHSKNDVGSIKLITEHFPNTKVTLSHFESEDYDESTNESEEKWVDYVRTQVKKKLEYQSFNEEISRYVNRESFAITNQFDVFVFTTKPRNFWTRLFDPSTTLSMLTDLETPALVFKLPQSS